MHIVLRNFKNEKKKLCPYRTNIDVFGSDVMKPYFENQREATAEIECRESFDNITAPHFHSNFEFVYVLSGEIDININGKTARLKKGEASAALNYDIHSYNSFGKSKVHVLIVPTKFVRSFLSISNGRSFANCFYSDESRTKEINRCFKMIFQNINTNNKLILKGYIYVILSIFSEKLGFDDKRPDSSIDFARNILIYLQNNFTEKITLDTLSEQFGYNKYYISRLFNSYIGFGLNEYINALRCRYAGTLIEDNDDNITEIAYKCGFENTRSFNRAFLSCYGTSPTKYKESIKKD